MAVETNARIEFSVASVEEWEKVNPKLHQGEPVFAKKPSGKYILKVGAPGGSTYKNAVVVWDQDDAETKMTSTQEAAAQALASKNAASASASAAKVSENAAAASKSAAATSESNAKTSETNAAASANTAKAWSMSDSSPDGVSGNKSAKTWAEEAKTSASASASNASASSSSATNSANSAKAAKQSETASANSASASASSASAASTSASNAKVSETNAAKSASAAAQSAKEAATFEPTNYYSRSEVDAKIPTKVSQLSNDANYTHKAYVDEMFNHIESGTTEDILLSGYTAKTLIIQTKYPHDTSKPVILSLMLPPARPESNSWAGMIPVFEGWIDSTHFRLTAWNNNNNVTSHCRFTWLCF